MLKVGLSKECEQRGNLRVTEKCPGAAKRLTKSSCKNGALTRQGILKTIGGRTKDAVNAGYALAASFFAMFGVV